MKSLLVVSVLLNLILAVLTVIWYPQKTEKTARTHAGSVEKTNVDLAPTKPGATFGGSVVSETPRIDPSIWRGSKSQLLKQLKEWGTPDDIIVEVLLAHNKAFLNKKRLEILYPSGVNRWSVRAKATPESLAKLDKLYAQNREEIRQVMGPAFDLALADADPMRRLKWGNLTDEQTAKIKQISEHYDSVKTKTLGHNPSSLKESFASAALIESEFAVDIREALPPTQAEDFLAFNSPAALALQSELARGGVELDEATYLKLLEADRNFRKEFLESKLTEHAYDTRVRQIKMFESNLGTDHALAIATASMSNFQAIDAALASEKQDAASRLNLYYEYMQTTTRIAAAQGLLLTDPATAKAMMAMEGENFYRLMSAKLSPQKLEEFKKSRGGQFLEVWRKGG